MIIIQQNNLVDARELHTTLGSRKHFATWFNKRAETLMFLAGKDYYPKQGKSYGGRPTVEFDLTIESAKELCTVEYTAKGKEVRTYLIGLSTKVDNLELKTDDQFLFMVKVIQCLKFVSNQKEAEQIHRKHFLDTMEYGKNPFSEFHIHRNALIGWDKKKVGEVYKKWLLTQGKTNSALTTMRDRINVMDCSEAIRIAVIEILFANGTEQQVSNIFSNAIKELAKKMETQALRENETNLLMENVPTIDVKQIKVR